MKKLFVASMLVAGFTPLAHQALAQDASSSDTSTNSDSQTNSDAQSNSDSGSNY